MSRTVAFAYPGARIQARFGRLVPAAQWERLARVPEFGSFLQAARDTPLRPWVLQLDMGADAHRIEAHLRTAFRRSIAALAGWVPRDWQAAVAWVETLVDLPVLAHRLRGGAAVPWMAADPRFARMIPAADDPAPPGDGLRVFATAGKKALAEVWLDHWRTLWPRMRPRERAALEQLAALLKDAARTAARDASEAAASLQQPLRKTFRRHTRGPAGLFAWLALSWIEVSQLRGALLRRRLSLPLEGAAA